MATQKENIMHLIKELPDDATLEDIMYHLHVKQKILRGLEDSKNGNIHDDEDMKKMARKWLK